MKKLFLWLPLGLLVLLVVIFARMINRPEPPVIAQASGNIRVDKPMPDLVLPKLASHETVASDDLVQPGKITILNFFASWCRPCLEEHAELSALSQHPDLLMVGVAWHDKPDAARLFLERQGNPFDLVLSDQNGQTSMRWGLTGVPETFLINDQKRIIGHWAGPITADIRTGRLMPLIAGGGGK